MDFPRLVQHGTRSETGTVGTSVMTTVTSSGSTNTKGSYSQLIAATSFDTVGILVQTHGVAGANSDRLIDIAIGAEASEVVVISNISCFNQGDQTFTWLYFPLRIPAGSRVSARSQSTSATQNSGVNVVLFGGGFIGGQALSIVETYGANTADSGGTSVDPGTSANTKGSWVELSAAVTREIRALGLAFGVAVTARTSTGNWLVDIGIGAAASEVVIIGNIAMRCDSATDTIVPSSIGCLPIQIPAGSRLAIRAQCDITTADRTFDAIAYGVS